MGWGKKGKRQDIFIALRRSKFVLNGSYSSAFSLSTQFFLLLPFYRPFRLLVLDIEKDVTNTSCVPIGKVYYEKVDLTSLLFFLTIRFQFSRSSSFSFSSSSLSSPFYHDRRYNDHRFRYVFSFVFYKSIEGKIEETLSLYSMKRRFDIPARFSNFVSWSMKEFLSPIFFSFLSFAA